MNEENIKKFLETLQNDPSALELMKGMDAPQDQDGEIKAYARLAGKLGYDITESDLREYLTWMESHMQQKTEEASSKIQELPDEALENVAGGKKEHNNCKDTYRNAENCWGNDACDIIYHWYKDYLCKRTEYPDPCKATARPCDNNGYCFQFGDKKGI